LTGPDTGLIILSPANPGLGQDVAWQETLNRGMAQPGSASALGAEGREFESLCPDQFFRIDMRCLEKIQILQLDPK
jgi:hypothetical protein